MASSYVCSVCRAPITDTTAVSCSNCGVNFNKVAPTAADAPPSPPAPPVGVAARSNATGWRLPPESTHRGRPAHGGDATGVRDPSRHEQNKHDVAIMSPKCVLAQGVATAKASLDSVGGVSLRHTHARRCGGLGLRFDSAHRSHRRSAGSASPTACRHRVPRHWRWIGLGLGGVRLGAPCARAVGSGGSCCNLPDGDRAHRDPTVAADVAAARMNEPSSDRVWTTFLRLGARDRRT
jgi:hypothetical protein